MIGATTGIKAEPTWLAASAGTNRICITSIALLPAGLFLLALGSVHGGAVLQGGVAMMAGS